MIYTPSRTWRKRSTERDGGPSSFGELRRNRVLWLPLVLTGCVGQVEVHPDYEQIGPTGICLEPVRNETIHDLRQVSFGGILQRVLVGPETLDVPAILQASLQDALTRRGYETRLDCDGSEPATVAGAEAPEIGDASAEGGGAEYDARCRLVVEEWSSDRVSSASIQMVFRVELDRVSTGERLFTGRYRYAFLEDSGEPHANDLPASLAGAVKTALTTLPQSPK
jgi:hypothetical protein